MTMLALAIERQMWSLVALYLLLGVAQAATQLPPQSLAALLDALEGIEAPRAEPLDEARGEG